MTKLQAELVGPQRQALVQLTDRDLVAWNRRIKQLSEISNRPAAASFLSFVMLALPVRSPIAASSGRHHTSAGIVLRLGGVLCNQLPHLSRLPLCISGREKFEADRANLIVSGR